MSGSYSPIPHGHAAMRARSESGGTLRKEAGLSLFSVVVDRIFLFTPHPYHAHNTTRLAHTSQLQPLAELRFLL
ncbi:hypothetical protein I312_100534 [Cryptococcus bacillisporus CA1280]|uniref:uncharacterized protein n=1 Tax=Cryptococcus bacillisporus CA1280 TaxID=1296109 RepID=UPI0033688B8C